MARLWVLCYPGSAAELLRPQPMVLPQGRGLRRGVGRARAASCVDVPRDEPGRAALSFAAPQECGLRDAPTAYHSSDSSPDGSFRARSAGGRAGGC